MAENNHNQRKTVAETISNVNMEDFINGMNEKPLMKSFMKYFTSSPANMIRSIDFGKSLFRYFAPDVEMPNDPATLLNATRNLFTVGFADKQITDEAFVRFMLDKVEKEPDLITFDMIADLLESDVFRKFGKGNTKDAAQKTKFVNWIVKDSMLSKIDQCADVDIVLNVKGMLRVLDLASNINVVYPNYFNKITDKLQEFDENYLNHVDGDLLKNLKRIAHSKTKDYPTQLKDVYKLLCDPEKADLIAEVIDGSSMGTDSKVRNAMLMGLGTTTNKILMAVAQRKNWQEKDLENVYLKFPIEKSAEKFEAHEQQINQKAAAQKNVATQDANNVQNDTTKKFNPILDVVKTFSGTLTGAAVISTITSIPGVGQIVGPAMGVTMVATAGISSALAAYKQAKKSGEVSKSDAKKIALKSGIAMLGKAWPYAAAMALGPAGRMLGSAVVFAKTLSADLERRAGKQQEKAKGILGKIKQAARNVSFVDGLKSLAYAASKGAAVFLGGQIGSEIGSSIGANVSFENGKLDLDRAGVTEDLQQTKIGKLFGKFKGLHGNENNSVNNLHPAQGVTNDTHLSRENLQRLNQIGDVELTDHARATAFVENDRQYVGGVQQDWYTPEGQQNAFQTLRNAGVEDPAGVLRKVGSMSRFFGGTYQDTLDNLCAGKISNQDVNNIFDALHQINTEGGLGRIMETDNTTAVPNHTQAYRVSTDNNIVTPVKDTAVDQSIAMRYVPDDQLEPVDVPPHTQDYRTPNTVETATAVLPQEPVVDELTNTDVPSHTQDYRTPDTVQTVAVQPVDAMQTDTVTEMPSHSVDIDNSIDYQDETLQPYTDLEMPAHTQDYRAATMDMKQDISSMELPSHTQDYQVSTENQTVATADMIYGGNDGEHDYYLDQQGNEYVVDTNRTQIDLHQAVPKMNLFGPDFTAQTASAETDVATLLPSHNTAMVDVQNEIDHLQKLDLSDFRSAEYIDNLSNDKIKAISDYMNIPYQEIDPDNDSFVAMREKNTANRDAVWDRLQSQHDFTWKTATPGSSEMKPLANAMTANQAKALETLDLIMQDQGMDR